MVDEEGVDALHHDSLLARHNSNKFGYALATLQS